MPITNLQPQIATTPDQGGSIAVTSISTTGHSSTQNSVGSFALPESSSNNSGSKSARWSSFQPAPPGPIVSLRLKFNYSVTCFIDANPGDGSAFANGQYSLEYSLNGGANWTVIATDFRLVGNGSDSFSLGGSVDIPLSVGQNISQVQV